MKIKFVKFLLKMLTNISILNQTIILFNFVFLTCFCLSFFFRHIHLLYWFEYKNDLITNIHWIKYVNKKFEVVFLCFIHNSHIFSLKFHYKIESKAFFGQWLSMGKGYLNIGNENDFIIIHDQIRRSEIHMKIKIWIFAPKKSVKFS